ncbi:hypothetical protein [Aquimarina sp. LLG6339-5]
MISANPEPTGDVFPLFKTEEATAPEPKKRHDLLDKIAFINICSSVGCGI